MLRFINRPAVLGGCIIVAASAMGRSQEAAVPESTPDIPKEIVVTGSRIKQPEYSATNPVVSINSEALQYSGYTNLTDFLREIPALVGSLDSNDSAGGSANSFIGSTGLNLLNLRNLGTDRTLVLVNGRRHVASLPGEASVDINAIPTDLIERIDILTGGASAIYGADGVTGVVNFVLKDNFSGFNVRAQYGTPEDGGNAQRLISLTAGRNFFDERANLIFNVELGHDSQLSAFDRPYSSTGETRFVRNPLDPDDDPTIPDRVPLTGLGWFGSSRGGAVDVLTDDDEGGLAFDYFADFDGNTDDFWDPGEFPGGIQGLTYALGGSATPVGGYSGDILPRERYVSTNILGSFRASESVKFFTELKFVNTKSFSLGQPTFDFFLLINGDNPFIPTNIANAAAGGEVLVTRDNFDFGIRGEDIDRKTYRGVVGAEGDITDWLQFNVSAVYGQTDVDALSLNNRFNDRFAAALDAVVDPDSGQVVCRSNLDPTALGPNVDFQGWATPTSFTPGANSGCVPINIFGEGSPSAEAVDWIMTNSLERDVVRQKVVSAYVTGDSSSFFQYPAGSIGFATGLEWRRESAEATPPIEDQLGLTFGNQIAPTRGAYEVAELFAEVNVPILKERKFAHRLSLDAAIRLSDYTTVGNTETWKTGIVWAPIPSVSFRGTYAQSVRAPNISELFSPQSQTFLQVDDPCDVANLNLGTEFRAGNCAELLASLGVDDPDAFSDPNQGVSIAGLQLGNTDLQEEVAKTTTAGVVLRPASVPELVLSVDFYDIDLTSAINTLDPQDISEQCVDLPTLDNQFCDLLTRENGGTDAGGINSFTIRPVNVAAFRTKGYDISTRYFWDLNRAGSERNFGKLDVHFIGSYLKDLFFVNLPGADPDPDIGEQDAPRRQFSFDLLWQRDAWLINYGVSYFGSTQRFTLQQRAGEPDIAEARYLNFDSATTHDLQVRYRVFDKFSAFFGINNLTNEQPELGQVFYPVGALGRYYYLGINFGDID
jgi:iron complex outermembrane recepter protein